MKNVWKPLRLARFFSGHWYLLRDTMIFFEELEKVRLVVKKYQATSRKLQLKNLPNKQSDWQHCIVKNQGKVYHTKAHHHRYTPLFSPFMDK